MTNEEKIAQLNAIIEKAKAKRAELGVDEDIELIDDLEADVEEVETAHKSKSGSGK